MGASNTRARGYTPDDSCQGIEAQLAEVVSGLGKTRRPLGWTDEQAARWEELNSRRLVLTDKLREARTVERIDAALRGILVGPDDYAGGLEILQERLGREFDELDRLQDQGQLTDDQAARLKEVCDDLSVLQIHKPSGRSSAKPASSRRTSRPCSRSSTPSRPCR